MKVSLALNVLLAALLLLFAKPIAEITYVYAVLYVHYLLHGLGA